MAYKRSRATFEADLQAQQSPYVVYGTALPPLDPESRDDGSYVPVWKQEVTDEQGRKRLHGAFTGGFSAGYFNTVGSKEGWTPSTFVSSRGNRLKDASAQQQKPEDFMDEEDLAEAEEARTLHTTDDFAGLGSSKDNGPQREPFMDIMRSAGETMGIKLLKKMGWREGQGIGPKVRRKARLGEDEGDITETAADIHSFAPENSRMISFLRKNDRKGLGFAGEELLGRVGDDDDHSHINSQPADNSKPIALIGKTSSKQEAQPKSGIGIGILNDTGSDDEDPYHIGPQISYTRVVGGNKKTKPKTKKKAEHTNPSANPLLSSKPIFISKKTAVNKGARRRCHDGRLPLDGFILADLAISLARQEVSYPPPDIPTSWTSSKKPLDAGASADPKGSYKSPAEVAAAAKLSPRSRAALLGEAQLPGKSVFDFLTPAARDRIASATKNDNLPPALSEAEGMPANAKGKTLSSLVPSLARETALTALGRGTAGWMPYTEDPSKRVRYQTFLENRAGLQAEGTLPDRVPGTSNEDWVNEMNEFARAAQIFKPMSGAMANRFSTSSSAPKLASDNVKLEEANGRAGSPSLLSQPASKTRTPAEEAAAAGMYGPLTRSIEQFYPTRLLCKRFNVKPPSHVQSNVNDTEPGPGGPPSEGMNQAMHTHSAAQPQRSLELVGKKDMDELRSSGGLAATYVGNSELNDALEGEVLDASSERQITVDPERNEALEKERPGDAIFKAIFGSDSEDD